MKGRSRMRIGVILDGASLARWQAEALQTVAGDAAFVFTAASVIEDLARRCAG